MPYSLELELHQPPQFKKRYLINPKRANSWIGASPRLSDFSLNDPCRNCSAAKSFSQLEYCNWPNLVMIEAPPLDIKGLWSATRVEVVLLPAHCCSCIQLVVDPPIQKTKASHDNCGKNLEKKKEKGAAYGWQQNLTNMSSYRNQNWQKLASQPGVASNAPIGAQLNDPSPGRPASTCSRLHLSQKIVFTHLVERRSGIYGDAAWG